MKLLCTSMKLIFSICVLLVAAGVTAQEKPTSTPEPAEDAAVGKSDANNTEQDSRDRARIEPFLQDDLDLLVGNVQRPNAMVWFEDHLYTVCNGDWTIYQINDRTGDTITYVFGVKNSNSILAESTLDGFDFWVPDPDSETLWRVNQDRQAPAIINDQLPAPWGIARIGDDQLLITDTRENSIVRLSETGETLTLANDLRAPTGIVVDENLIYFANGGSARRGIEWLEIQDDGSVSEPNPLVTGLQNTTNIILGSDGFLYFAYALGTRGVIGRVNPEECLAGGCTSADTEMVVFSDITAPLSITLSPDLRLFLHSRFRPEIYWVQLPT